MGIGRLKCGVIDVTDLRVAEEFWSEVTGLPVIPSAFPGRYSYVGRPEPWRCDLILHRVRTAKGDETNRCHIDLWVRDVDKAVAAVEAIGGTRKFGPIIYPRPGAYAGERPVLDWVVMRDPFGNEFCLTSLLSHDEGDAVLQAGEDADDHALRVAAGRATADR